MFLPFNHFKAFLHPRFSYIIIVTLLQVQNFDVFVDFGILHRLFRSFRTNMRRECCRLGFILSTVVTICYCISIGDTEYGRRQKSAFRKVTSQCVPFAYLKGLSLADLPNYVFGDSGYCTSLTTTPSGSRL